MRGFSGSLARVFGQKFQLFINESLASLIDISSSFHVQPLKGRGEYPVHMRWAPKAHHRSSSCLSAMISEQTQLLGGKSVQVPTVHVVCSSFLWGPHCAHVYSRLGMHCVSYFCCTNALHARHHFIQQIPWATQDLESSVSPFSSTSDTTMVQNFSFEKFNCPIKCKTVVSQFR